MTLQISNNYYWLGFDHVTILSLGPQATQKTLTSDQPHKISFFFSETESWMNTAEN